MDTGYVLTLLSDIAAYIGLVTLFYQAFDWRLPRKKVRNILMGICGVGSVIYCICCYRLPEAGVSPFSLLCFSLPGLAADIMMAKYRDFRLIFTYCIIDVIGFALSIILRLIFAGFASMEWLLFLLTVICYVGLNLIFRRVQQEYWTILKGQEKRWGFLALVAFGFYFMLYFITIYPTPLVRRMEYAPVAVLFAVLTLAVCVVLFITLRSVLESQIYLDRLERQAVYAQYAYVDILTGLKNRRAFEEALKEEEAGKKDVLGLALLDMNNLKQINDKGGHTEGDRALQNLAEFLLKHKGQSEAYRVGGDEFALITHLPSKERIIALFECIRKELEQEPSGISAAMGYGVLENYESCHIDQFMKRVDQEMYARKRMMKEKLM